MIMEDIKLLGGWASDSVVKGYVDDTDRGRKKRARAIVGEDEPAPPSKVAATVSGQTFTGSSVNITGGNFQGCSFIIQNPTNE